MSTSKKRLQARYQRADRRYLPQFKGVDGEGGNIDGRHEYQMLRAGDHVLYTGKALSTYECLNFLANLPLGVIYISYAFDYDVTMMLRELPVNRLERLFDRECRVIMVNGKPTSRCYPVAVGPFEIDYIPRKEFRVRHKGRTRWIVISDTFTFFASKFTVALTTWFGDEPRYQRAIKAISEGKEQRSTFGILTRDEYEYNHLECIMLEKLINKMRALCIELDIKPRQWQGPGQLVSAVFAREGMPRRGDMMIPDDIWYWANVAYCAGRFENRVYGRISGVIRGYDLNSAYASTYRELPCLRHGRWKHSRAVPPGIRCYLTRLSFHHRTTMSFYCLPVRSKQGTLLFPREGNGVYWNYEVEVCKKYADITVHDVWYYERECDCDPFAWVYDMYALRARVGKISGQGKVLKTVLATIYGKLAQSKGHPQYSNPVWAGLIVSHCRARLIDAALQNGGDDILALATDGMFCVEPRDVVVGEDLGQWTLTEYNNGMFVQSGLYFVGNDKPKTRGVPQSKVIEHKQDIIDVWDQWLARPDLNTPPSLSINLRGFIGLRVALARNKPELAGLWDEHINKKISFDWTTKRINPRIVDDCVFTDPVDGSPWLVSEPPPWMVGGSQAIDPESLALLLDSQPDWSDLVEL